MHISWNLSAKSLSLCISLKVLFKMRWKFSHGAGRRNGSCSRALKLIHLSPMWDSERQNGAVKLRANCTMFESIFLCLIVFLATITKQFIVWSLLPTKIGTLLIRLYPAVLLLAVQSLMFSIQAVCCRPILSSSETSPSIEWYQW